MCLLKSLCFLSITLFYARFANSEDVTISTRQGKLKGFRTQVDDDSFVDAFLNIPFAKPPVGKLRFSAPEPSCGWSGVRDARKYGAKCPQANDTYVLPWQEFAQDEDCLYLNVYRPKISDPGQRLAVMHWIHGGGFYMGTGNRYNWTALAAQGVIVVTSNYRLGALGFLSTEDETSPGNYGLWDQIMALKWIRDTIYDFNGDSSRVTIFGESAGSASVSMLVLSQPARGLFHRAIMESGASLCPWATGYPGTRPEARQIALALGEAVGCISNDSSTLIACLRTKPASLIRDAQIKIQDTIQSESYRPIPEASFGVQNGVFSAAPEWLLQHGLFAKVPTIRGFNHDEMATWFPDSDTAGLSLEKLKGMLNFTRHLFLEHTVYPLDVEKVMNQIMESYFSSSTDPIQLRQAFIQMETDFQMIGPITYEAEQVAMANYAPPVYVYRFSQRSANRLNAKWKGVQHVDDIPYVTGAPVINIQALPNFVSNWTSDDINVSKNLLQMWSNFAKYGKPDVNGVETWLPWTQGNPRLLDISSKLEMIKNPISTQQNLIINILKKMYGGS